MTVVGRPPSFSSFLFLCFPLLATLCRTSDAVGSAMIEAINCSTSGNYTPAGAYATNLNQFLAALPENAVSKNGGFFNGTVGEGAATVYGLAMCSADYSRADCGDCLAATAGSNTGALPNRCPGSTTVLAVFDKCLVRYSDANFLGTAETDVIYSSGGAAPSSSAMAYSGKIKDRLQLLTGDAVSSPQRFASAADPPYALMQCTWDLPPDKCKQCLDVLSANASDWFSMTIQGERKTYSCTVRYSNTSFVVVPFNDASSGQLPPTSSVDQTATSVSPSTAQGSRTVSMVIGSVVAVVLAALLAGSLWYVRRLPRQHKIQEEDAQPTATDQTHESTFNATTAQNQASTLPSTSNADSRMFFPREFNYAELVRATNNFAEGRMIGQGAFGAVYKGILPGIAEHVAVKNILDTVSDQSRRAFATEISIMSKLHHRNIISFLGSCNEKEKLLLVYEIVENGNLEDHLYPRNGTIDSRLNHTDSSSQLGWPVRRNIILGIVSGLAYLHTECKKAIVHRDVKPGNVMLDRHFNAKLADFGLVTQLNHTQTSRGTNHVIGSVAYIDPVYKETAKASGHCDVYSLGVMLLEIVCGEKPTLTEDGKTNLLIAKVRKYDANNRILDAAHIELRGIFDGEMKLVLEIGLKCVSPNRQDRPYIGFVKTILSELTKSTASTSQNRQQNEQATRSQADAEADQDPFLA